MPTPQQRVLRNDILQTEYILTRIEVEFGKSSPQYQEQLKKFSRLWAVLKMTHAREDFLKDVIAS